MQCAAISTRCPFPGGPAGFFCEPGVSSSPAGSIEVSRCGSFLPQKLPRALKLRTEGKGLMLSTNSAPRSCQAPNGHRDLAHFPISSRRVIDRVFSSQAADCSTTPVRRGRARVTLLILKVVRDAAASPISHSWISTSDSTPLMLCSQSRGTELWELPSHGITGG